MGKWSAYVVTAGTQPGVYDSWPEAAARVLGIPDSIYKGYTSREEAEEIFRRAERDGLVRRIGGGPFRAQSAPPPREQVHTPATPQARRHRTQEPRGHASASALPPAAPERVRERSRTMSNASSDSEPTTGVTQYEPEDPEASLADALTNMGIAGNTDRDEDVPSRRSDTRHVRVERTRSYVEAQVQTQVSAVRSPTRVHTRPSASAPVARTHSSPQTHSPARHTAPAPHSPASALSYMSPLPESSRSRHSHSSSQSGYCDCEARCAHCGKRKVIPSRTHSRRSSALSTPADRHRTHRELERELPAETSRPADVPTGAATPVELGLHPMHIRAHLSESALDPRSPVQRTASVPFRVANSQFGRPSPAPISGLLFGS